MRLFDIQGGACHWCGRQMYRDRDCLGGSQAIWYRSIEHLRPRNDPEYRQAKVAAHLLCNAVRNMVSHRRFVEFVNSARFAALYAHTFGTAKWTMRTRAVRHMVRQLARAEKRKQTG